MNTGLRWQIAMVAVFALLLAAGGAQMWPASGPTGPRAAATPHAARARSPSWVRGYSPAQRRDDGGAPLPVGGPDESWSKPTEVPDGLRTMGLPIFVDGTQMGTPEGQVLPAEPGWEDTDLAEVDPEE